jgi:hypothetical protein
MFHSYTFVQPKLSASFRARVSRIVSRSDTGQPCVHPPGIPVNDLSHAALRIDRVTRDCRRVRKRQRQLRVVAGAIEASAGSRYALAIHCIYSQLLPQPSKRRVLVLVEGADERLKKCQIAFACWWMWIHNSALIENRTDLHR